MVWYCLVVVLVLGDCRTFQGVSLRHTPAKQVHAKDGGKGTGVCNVRSTGTGKSVIFMKHGFCADTSTPWGIEAVFRALWTTRKVQMKVAVCVMLLMLWLRVLGLSSSGMGSRRNGTGDRNRNVCGTFIS